MKTTLKINHKTVYLSPDYFRIDTLSIGGSRLFTCCLLFAVMNFSCKKFVEIPPPISQLVTASVFNNDASATSAVTAIYTQMFNYDESFYMANNNGLLADELTNWSGKDAYGNSAFNFYQNSLNTIGVYVGPWQNAYNYIYQANAIIEGLQQYEGTSAAVKQQLTGEAYFIRAFWHFYLTNLYGAVPVALTTNYAVTEKLARTSRVQVLQQVVNDLQIAKTLLSNNYVDLSDTAITIDRVRPNKYVAEALLARAYLYLGDYSSDNGDYAAAEKAADSVINNASEYSLCVNLSGANSVFLANSTETIWQLYTPLPNTVDTKDGNGFILLAKPTGVAISPQLLTAFEPGDQRKVNWIGSITEDTSTYYFPYKYKQYTYTGTEYTMVLRLAEQYLIRSEAEAEQGDNSDAINGLNIIRNRAGLPNSTLTAASPKADVLAAILHERQVELFTEWGARWFDLNRAAKNDPNGVNVTSVMSGPNGVCAFKGGNWNPNGYQELYPIPQADILIDHNLTQNQGY